MFERYREPGNLLTSLFDERGRHRLTAFATAVCVVFSALTVLFATAPAVDAVQDDYVQIKVGTILEPDDFNPFTMTTGISYTVAWMMYEMLYTTGPSREPCAQLATDHYRSEDGLVWTYNLTEDSVWHDGQPVTAHDVAFTFNMILEYPDECALLGGYLYGFVYPVVALDDYTVRITLEYPKSTMLAITVPVLPEHLWADVAADGEIKTVDLWDADYFPDGPVGSGPMALNEYDKAQGFIRLLAHPEGYHQLAGTDIDTERINVDEILMIIFKNEQAMTTAIETGEIDVVDGVPESLWESLMENPDVEGQAPGALDLTEVGFNCASEELRNKLLDNGQPAFRRAATNLEPHNTSVRQAIAMVVNQTYIVEDILQGLGEEADSLIPTATPFWHWYVPEEEKWPVDSAAANELLNRSGYGQFDGSDDFSFAGVRENETSGAKLEFEFYYISATMRDELSAFKIADWCEDIGVKLNLNGVAEGTLYNMWFNLEYDMFIWNWQPDVDPSFLLDVLTTQQIPEDSTDITAWSDCYYSNPEYDALYDAQLTAMDPYERQEIIHEMQQIAYRDCPYIMLWYPCSLVAYRSDLWMNLPDMERYGGSTPDTIWFYFSIEPYEEGANTDPYNVNAGEDVTVYVGDELTLSGTAEDLESPTEDLDWTWTIDELGEETVLYEQTVQYTFDIVGAHSVTLTVEDPEGASASDSLTVTVEEIPEEGIGWIVGSVEDASGEPVKGALVSIVGTDRHENVDELGEYNISIVPGTYVVNASADGYSNDSNSVIVVADAVSWSNFTLGITSGSVTGLVLDAATEEPVADALVELYTPGEETASYLKKTDDNGSFEILLVDEGTYEVVVSRTGYETNDTENVTVTPEETSDLVVYLTATEEKGEGDGGWTSSTATIAIAALAIIAAVAVAALLLKRKKGSEPDLPDDESPPDQTTELPEPPGA